MNKNLFIYLKSEKKASLKIFLLLSLFLIPISFSLQIDAGTIIQPSSGSYSGYYVVVSDAKIDSLIFDDTNAYLYRALTELILVNYDTSAVISQGHNATLPPTNSIINLDIQPHYCELGSDTDVLITYDFHGSNSPFRTVTKGLSSMKSISDSYPIIGVVAASVVVIGIVSMLGK